MAEELTPHFEDVQAHYNLMLCFRGLGQSEKAEREETLFRRFKADEASQQLTARPRQLSPEDNNERQPIHDHASEPGFVTSVPSELPALAATPRGSRR